MYYGQFAWNKESCILVLLSILDNNNYSNNSDLYQYTKYTYNPTTTNSQVHVHTNTIRAVAQIYTYRLLIYYYTIFTLFDIALLLIPSY